MGSKQRRRWIEEKPPKRVRVVGEDGKPLWPCTWKRAEELIRKGEAYVQSREPFTICVPNRRAGDGVTVVHPAKRTAPRATGRRDTSVGRRS